DRYSDLDFHFLLGDNDLPTFKADVESWLSTLRPLVLYNLLFDGRMVNALTHDGLRIDIWFHTEDSVKIDPSTARVVFNRGDYLQFRQEAALPDSGAIARRLEQQTKEFWRCIALLPSVIGCNELITAFMGLTVETNVVTDLILTGYGIARDHGV